MSVLITYAKDNPQHSKSFLQHHYKEYKREESILKMWFVNDVIKGLATHEFDTETWNILNELICNLDAYDQPDIYVQLYLRAIAVYNILHEENIPEAVEENLSFNTFKKFHSLKEEQNNKLFSHLLRHLISKIQIKQSTSETYFNKVIQLKDIFFYCEIGIKISQSILVFWTTP